jgi:hypothetical protein
MLNSKKTRERGSSAPLHFTIAKGLDGGSNKRWDKYDLCLKLGVVKAGQSDASELGLKVFMPTWMQCCLTGFVAKQEKDKGSTSAS